MIKILIKRLSKSISLPKYETVGSSGMDLAAYVDAVINLKPRQTAIVPTGLYVAIPEGLEIQIRPRSGLAAKNSISVLNTPGTIDSDYRGEIKVPIINLGSEDFIVERGMRIAQLIIARYERIVWDLVDQLPENTTRGDSGFGSTGLDSK